MERLATDRLAAEMERVSADLSRVTIEDMENMYHMKGMCIILNSGRVLGFAKEGQGKWS